MQFEWDEAKNLENIRKHQIDFADMPRMFEAPMLIELDDRFDYGEDRWLVQFQETCFASICSTLTLNPSPIGEGLSIRLPSPVGEGLGMRVE